MTDCKAMEPWAILLLPWNVLTLVFIWRTYACFSWWFCSFFNCCFFFRNTSALAFCRQGNHFTTFYTQLFILILSLIGKCSTGDVTGLLSDRSWIINSRLTVGFGVNAQQRWELTRKHCFTVVLDLCWHCSVILLARDKSSAISKRLLLDNVNEQKAMRWLQNKLLGSDSVFLLFVCAGHVHTQLSTLQICIQSSSKPQK